MQLDSILNNFSPKKLRTLTFGELGVLSFSLLILSLILPYFYILFVLITPYLVYRLYLKKCVPINDPDCKLKITPITQQNFYTITKQQNGKLVSQFYISAHFSNIDNKNIKIIDYKIIKPKLRNPTIILTLKDPKSGISYAQVHDLSIRPNFSSMLNISIITENNETIVKKSKEVWFEITDNNNYTQILKVLCNYIKI